jgi:D-xylulose reductase
MGHEASGTISSVGSAVTSIRVGDRVAIEPGTPCRACKRCKAGTYNLCPKMRFAAAPGPPDTPGTLAKYFKIAEDFVYKLPEHVSLEEGVLVEPLAVAVKAVKQVDVRPGEKVVVMGGGTVGLLCACVAKVFGASEVVIVDISEEKVKFAQKYLPQGCKAYLTDLASSIEENANRILRTTLEFEEEDGVDVVIEASGAASAVETGICVLRKGGKYVQVGLGKPRIEFPIVAFSEKELLFRGCFRYGSGDFELAVDLLRRGVVQVEELITDIVEFEHATFAWDSTQKGQGIKNMIRGVQD